jgi:hypothetical protein
MATRKPYVQRVVEAVDAAAPGAYVEVDIPYKKPVDG